MASCRPHPHHPQVSTSRCQEETLQLQECPSLEREKGVWDQLSSLSGHGTEPTLDSSHPEIQQSQATKQLRSRKTGKSSWYQPLEYLEWEQSYFPVTYQKKERTQINKITNERGDIETDTKENAKIYNRLPQYYRSQVYTLEKGINSETYKLSRLNHEYRKSEETDNRLGD